MNQWNHFTVLRAQFSGVEDPGFQILILIWGIQMALASLKAVVYFLWRTLSTHLPLKVSSGNLVSTPYPVSAKIETCQTLCCIISFLCGTITCLLEPTHCKQLIGVNSFPNDCFKRFWRRSATEVSSTPLFSSPSKQASIPHKNDEIAKLKIVWNGVRWCEKWVKSQ